jgi:hypothetical protein
MFRKRGAFLANSGFAVKHTAGTGGNPQTRRRPLSVPFVIPSL